MDNKYKALSYVPPKPVNIKQRFGKLTLATCTSAEKPKLVRACTPPRSSSKKTYMYFNPNNNDERISDDSIITDDESVDDGKGLSGSERNKIINNILNSDDKCEDDESTDNEPMRQGNRSNCDYEPSLFSEKLIVNDSDETNCDTMLGTEMGKLGSTLNPPTPVQKKSSTPLFSTMSDTVVSRLSSQMDRLEINQNRNLPDEIKIRNSLMGNDLDLVKSETPINPDTSLTSVSILTISSTDENDESETEDNTDADSDVIILSSDEDDNRGSSESEIEKHVSNISGSSDTLNTQMQKKLSDFFNNIPSAESPDRDSSDKEYIPETPEEHEFIPETPENLSINDNQEPEPVINTDSSVVKMNSQVVPDPNISNDEDTRVSINISTKIHINIQISELEKTRCESSSPNEPEQGCERNESKSEHENSTYDETKTSSRSEDESINDQISPEVEANSNKFVGLNQTNVEIDEEMEGILNELYGKAWQTPQLLQKCISTKKTANKPLPKVNEPIDDVDFSLFGKKINDELESTRLPEQMMPKPTEKTKHSSKKKPTVSTKKVSAKKPPDSSSDEEERHNQVGHRRLDFESIERPKRKAALAGRQLLKVCDPDSTDSEESFENGSDSDLNFTINKKDIENDSDYEQEKENRTRERGIKKALHPYGYTKKPAIPATPPLSYELPVSTSKPGNSKRKLYTPQNYDIVIPDEETPLKSNSSTDKSLEKISNWLTLQNKKIEEIKKRDLFLTPKPTSKAKLEVPSKLSTRCQEVPLPKNERTYGFIASLDENIRSELRHPESIKYVDSYAKNKFELVDKLYEMYNDKIFNFTDKIDMRWNKKLTTTAGRCLTKRKNGERTCHIELSEKVLTSAGRLRCTLVHELCHAANWLYDGVNGHGVQWQAWASKARKVFPELPKIDVCHAYDIDYKYTYMCTNCKVKQQAHSKSMKVENKRCRYCYGKIEVFLNKKTRDGNVVQTPIRPATGFAKFVQDNYKTYKKDETKHADVMKILSSKFKELGVDKL